MLSSLSSQPVGGLPLISEGSASAMPVSRPAQRSLSFRPAWSLGHQGGPSLQRASIHVVASMNRSGRYQPERQLLGGVRTHQESAPFHGALRNPGYQRISGDPRPVEEAGNPSRVNSITAFLCQRVP